MKESCSFTILLKNGIFIYCQKLLRRRRMLRLIPPHIHAVFAERRFVTSCAVYMRDLHNIFKEQPVGAYGTYAASAAAFLNIVLQMAYLYNLYYTKSRQKKQQLLQFLFAALKKLFKITIFKYYKPCKFVMFNNSIETLRK